jgi:peptide deformylase
MSEITTDLKILRSHNDDATLEEAENIIKQLDISLKKSSTRGVGLAAPQIGINKRVAIVRSQDEFIDLVNPIIIEKTIGFVNFNESCLSIPNQCVNTQRYKEIFVKDDLHPDGFVAVGDVAIILEHEIDHLYSILITDRAVGKNKLGRNDPCPCGKTENGKPVKWKKCHGVT